NEKPENSQEIPILTSSPNAQPIELKLKLTADGGSCTPEDKVKELKAEIDCSDDKGNKVECGVSLNGGAIGIAKLKSGENTITIAHKTNQPFTAKGKITFKGTGAFEKCAGGNAKIEKNCMCGNTNVNVQGEDGKPVFAAYCCENGGKAVNDPKDCGAAGTTIELPKGMEKSCTVGTYRSLLYGDYVKLGLPTGEVCKDDQPYQLFMECKETEPGKGVGEWKVKEAVLSSGETCRFSSGSGECSPYTDTHHHAATKKDGKFVPICPPDPSDKTGKKKVQIWEKCQGALGGAKGKWIQYPTAVPCDDKFFEGGSAEKETDVAKVPPGTLVTSPSGPDGGTRTGGAQPPPPSPTKCEGNGLGCSRTACGAGQERYTEGDSYCKNRKDLGGNPQEYVCCKVTGDGDAAKPESKCTEKDKNMCVEKSPTKYVKCTGKGEGIIDDCEGNKICAGAGKCVTQTTPNPIAFPASECKDENTGNLKPTGTKPPCSGVNQIECSGVPGIPDLIVGSCGEPEPPNRLAADNNPENKPPPSQNAIPSGYAIIEDAASESCGAVNTFFTCGHDAGKSASFKIVSQSQSQYSLLCVAEGTGAKWYYRDCSNLGGCINEVGRCKVSGPLCPVTYKIKYMPDKNRNSDCNSENQKAKYVSCQDGVSLYCDVYGNACISQGTCICNSNNKQCTEELQLGCKKFGEACTPLVLGETCCDNSECVTTPPAVHGICSTKENICSSEYQPCGTGFPDCCDKPVFDCVGERWSNVGKCVKRAGLDEKCGTMIKWEWFPPHTETIKNPDCFEGLTCSGPPGFTTCKQVN
ncbi:MAG: hypothetical protein HYU02_05265, partial [Thaumarchaeota archaeon]|nr:hypothetical protein [Nitrososphaerota archaeon]